MLKEYDVYLAGPFFSPEQIAVMNRAKALLQSNGLTVCDPRDISPVIAELSDNEKGPKLFKEIFAGNIEGMNRSWVVIAWTDDKDTGTAFEMGYAFAVGALHTRGGLLSFSEKGKSANVMLSQATNGHFITLKQMSDWLTEAGGVGLIKDRKQFFITAKQWANE